MSVSAEKITDFKTTTEFKVMDKNTALKRKEMKQVLCAGKRITEARYTVKLKDLYSFLACLEPIRDNAMAISPEMISPSMPIFYTVTYPPFTSEGQKKNFTEYVFTALTNFRRLTVVEITLNWKTAGEVINFLEAKGYICLEGTFDFST